MRDRKRGSNISLIRFPDSKISTCAVNGLLSAVGFPVCYFPAAIRRRSFAIKTDEHLTLTKPWLLPDPSGKPSEKIPDILFLDIHMPCKDGRQCIKDIRADNRYDEMPVIIYSSFEDRRNIEYCFREGANLYIVKPIYFGDFVETIKRLLMMDRNAGLYYPAKSDFVVKQASKSNNSQM